MKRDAAHGRVTISLEKMVHSNMLVVEARAELLAEKGLLNQAEFTQRTKALKATTKPNFRNPPVIRAHCESQWADEELVRGPRDIEPRLAELRHLIAIVLADLPGTMHGPRGSASADETTENVAGHIAIRIVKQMKAWDTITKGYLNEREAAQLLEVSVYTLRRWRSKESPLGPRFVQLGGLFLYSLNELEIHQCPSTKAA